MSVYKKGWKGSNCTEDVDECFINSTLCYHKTESECTNTIGSYTCRCRSGFYEMDGNCLGVYFMLFPHKDTLWSVSAEFFIMCLLCTGQFVTVLFTLNLSTLFAFSSFNQLFKIILFARKIVFYTALL